MNSFKKSLHDQLHLGSKGQLKTDHGTIKILGTPTATPLDNGGEIELCAVVQFVVVAPPERK